MVTSEYSGGTHDRISPTAWTVAYERTKTDIPFSAEVFQILDGIVRQTRSEGDVRIFKELAFPGFTPFFEARYKLTNLLLEELRADQVLEVAAGFSQRGMVMAQDPRINYVEMDLPGVVEEKQKVVQEMQQQGVIGELPNLHIDTGSALVYEDLERATRHFAKRAIAIVNEGLLRYLPLDEKAIYARNVHTLLKEFGGAWITPDIDGRKMIQFPDHNAGVRAQNQQLFELTGIDVRSNYFESEDAARSFYEDLGFTVERRSFREVFHSLVSPAKEEMDADGFEKAFGLSAAYVMRVRS